MTERQKRATLSLQTLIGRSDTRKERSISRPKPLIAGTCCLAIALYAGGCASVPSQNTDETVVFNESLLEEYSIDESNIGDLQFYLAGRIQLEREITEDEARRIDQGQLFSREGRLREVIHIENGTKGQAVGIETDEFSGFQTILVTFGEDEDIVGFSKDRVQFDQHSFNTAEEFEEVVEELEEKFDRLMGALNVNNRPEQLSPQSFPDLWSTVPAVEENPEAFGLSAVLDQRGAALAGFGDPAVLYRATPESLSARLRVSQETLYDVRRRERRLPGRDVLGPEPAEEPMNSDEPAEDPVNSDDPASDTDRR